jgi:hypothetical protein
VHCDAEYAAQGCLLWPDSAWRACFFWTAGGGCIVQYRCVGSKLATRWPECNLTAHEQWWRLQIAEFHHNSILEAAAARLAGPKA